MDTHDDTLRHRLTALENENTALKAELGAANETHQRFTVKHIGCDLSLDTLRTEAGQLRQDLEDLRRRKADVGREGEGDGGEGRSKGEVEQGLRAEIEVLRAVIEESRISADRSAVNDDTLHEPPTNTSNVANTFPPNTGTTPCTNGAESPNLRLQLQTLRQSYDVLLSSHRELKASHASLARRHDDTARERQVVQDELDKVRDLGRGSMGKKPGPILPAPPGTVIPIHPSPVIPTRLFSAKAPQPAFTSNFRGNFNPTTSSGTTNGTSANGNDKTPQLIRSRFSFGNQQIPGHPSTRSAHYIWSQQEESLVQVQAISSDDETIQVDPVDIPNARDGPEEGDEEPAAEVPKGSPVDSPVNDDTTATFRRRRRRNRLPMLTTEMHTLIGGYLAGDNAYATLAAYSTVNRKTRQALLDTLFETVVWESYKSVEQAFGIRASRGKLLFPAGLKHTKSVRISHLRGESQD
ncbi:hypothetical protein QFC20_004024 [Naganishia adeliensis]|uniref:Uncharacterized protein n=1 Tax=Naganishia adeliensis TaxID=92952 RepID=A0ACC2W5G0_9TREE|nr:hypothetical protein QFC20_004024 [Naganishia adeliensis]